MSGNLARWATAFADRVEEEGARHGLAYPWWIAITSTVGQVGCAVVAAVQRDALVPPKLAALAVVLVAAPYVIQFARPWVPWWARSLFVLTGVALLLATRGGVDPQMDVTAGVLAILSAEIAATDGPKAGIAATAVSVGVFLIGGVSDGTGLHLAEIVFGLIVGAMLHSQMRAVVAERDARAGERERATLAERQRIAREIHDLVGHALSVTLLHVTGARRALSEDDDTKEAIEALTDAERIGRQAMTDIRRTVHVLAAEPEGLRPLPSAADLDRLVEDVRAAGLRVDYRVRGDRDVLSPSAGLGVYRVAQESLANVAKHAPDQPVEMELDVGSSRLRLRVRNRRPTPIAAYGRDGSGLAGMASRAEQLGGSCHAGPDGADWVVELDVPVARSSDSPRPRDKECQVRRMLP